MSTEGDERPIDESQLLADVASMMASAWRSPGFCVPNPATYPHQWLWDSCFHSIIWAALGSDRGVTELEHVLAHQHDDGFVPHMTYWSDAEAGAQYWGRSMTSSITQPPMYGHTAAELVRRGHEVPAELFARCRRGLTHLLTDRSRTSSGLIPVFHPWETGCDDSPRWDAIATDGVGRSVESWRVDKTAMVHALRFRAPGGSPRGSDRCSVGSIGFNALVAWNVTELAAIDEAGDLVGLADDLIATIDAQWDDGRSTWFDDGPGETRGVRTADALLPLLVAPRLAAFDQLGEATAFGTPFGPSGVHVGEATFDPDAYWRGPGWPQLHYLLWRAAESAPDAPAGLARSLGEGLVRNAMASQLGEYWNPLTGAGRGARPQTWTGLGIIPLS